MFKIASAAILLCILAGCAASLPPAASACAVEPGSYACQIEQYERVNE